MNKDVIFVKLKYTFGTIMYI